jgi:hypothetical protein
MQHFSKWDKATPAERFWSFVNKGGTIHPKLGTPCWLWTGAHGKYGSFKAEGHTVSAHVFSFFLENGYYANPQCLHKCDVPLCVNPEHLFEGTQQNNIDDCIAKGRARNGNIKLNPEIWETIRQSTESSTVLGERYGVDPAHVRKIRRGACGIVYRP